ncbi:MAG: GtrA family protein, partial [Polaribacter sp.]|nr:GtrA family protein [Polaribacter sp.]
MRNYSPLKKQVIKFILIGILAVVVDLICYYFLLRLLPDKAFSVISNEAFAKTISFLCGLNVTYIFNKSWT